MKNFKFSWGGGKNEIKFEKIKGLFDEKKWDIAYLSKDGFERVGNSPIKYNFHHVGYDKTNSLHMESYNKNHQSIYFPNCSRLLNSALISPSLF